MHASIAARSGSAGIAPFFVAQTEPAAFAKSAAAHSVSAESAETGCPASISFVRNAPKKLSP